MANVGDRLLARWAGEADWFYPGVVVGESGNALEVHFDDGDRGKVSPSEVFALPLRIGMRVYGNWQGGGVYYPGTIDAITGHAVHIAYDDGDHEVTSVSALRIHREDLP